MEINTVYFQTTVIYSWAEEMFAHRELFDDNTSWAEVMFAHRKLSGIGGFQLYCTLGDHLTVASYTCINGLKHV